MRIVLTGYLLNCASFDKRTLFPKKKNAAFGWT